MFYQQPSIEIFGLVLEAPITALTDLWVTAVCYYAFVKLRKCSTHNRIRSFLLIYFLSMGTATLFGGLFGHAFLHYFDLGLNAQTTPEIILRYISLDYIERFSALYMRLPGWLTSMVSVAFIERACIEQARPFISKRTARIFSIINIIELLTFMTISFSTLNFLFVELHTAYGFAIVVFSFSIFLYRKTRNSGNLFFIKAVIWSAPAAIFFMSGIGIGPWFNHVDISHFFMTISAWMFYRGAEASINSKAYKRQLNLEVLAVPKASRINE